MTTDFRPLGVTKSDPVLLAVCMALISNLSVNKFISEPNAYCKEEKNLVQQLFGSSNRKVF